MQVAILGHGSLEITSRFEKFQGFPVKVIKANNITHFAVDSTAEVDRNAHTVRSKTLASISLQIYPDYYPLNDTLTKYEKRIKELRENVVQLQKCLSNIGAVIIVDEKNFQKPFQELIQAQNYNSQMLQKLQIVLSDWMCHNGMLQQMIQEGMKVNEGNYKAIERRKLQLEGLEKEGEDKKEQLEQLNHAIVKCEGAYVANELTLTQQACTIDELEALIAAEELEHATRMEQEKKRLARSLKKYSEQKIYYSNKTTEVQVAATLYTIFLEQK